MTSPRRYNAQQLLDEAWADLDQLKEQANATLDWNCRARQHMQRLRLASDDFLEKGDIDELTEAIDAMLSDLSF